MKIESIHLRPDNGPKNPKWGTPTGYYVFARAIGIGDCDRRIPILDTDWPTEIIVESEQFFAGQPAKLATFKLVGETMNGNRLYRTEKGTNLEVFVRGWRDGLRPGS